MNLSIKNVSEEVVDLLRERAKRNHRSLQGELIAIIEDSVKPRKLLTVDDVYQRVKALGIKSGTESTEFIRGERDAR